MQQKDVIYIDVEDDITAIIGKVKAAKEKIVALVPPKRIGVLQSAVNLRLLARTAEQADKRLVLITGNVALSGLAASAKIPVAKNLQSRPELAPVPSADESDDDDVIDGGQIPVGDYAKSKDDDEDIIIPPSSISGLAIDGEDTPVKSSTEGKPNKPKKGIKVPDFGSFRKRMLFGGIGAVLLIVFLVWAIVFAPHATLTITAKTSDQAISNPVTLGADVATDSEKATLQSITKQEKVTQSVDFSATGKKDVGDRATGTVTFATSSISDLGTTIPANTQLSASNGLSYLTTQSVTISISNYTGTSVGITAAESGSKYNGASGNASGAPGNISAKIASSTSGGTDKTITIVQQSDVETAKQQIADQSTADVKKKLQADLGSDVVIISDSFATSAADAQSSPDVGQEASSGKAKLTRVITYSMTGVAKSQLKTYLSAALQKTLTNKSQQRIYDNGIDTAKLTDFKAGDRTATASLVATGQIGPQIDDNAIKDQVKGKRYGEIEGDLKAIDGVSDVSLQLSPFWVQTVPSDINKITVEFKLVKNG